MNQAFFEDRLSSGCDLHAAFTGKPVFSMFRSQQLTLIRNCHRYVRRGQNSELLGNRVLFEVALQTPIVRVSVPVSGRPEMSSAGLSFDLKVIDHGFVCWEEGNCSGNRK